MKKTYRTTKRSASHDCALVYTVGTRLREIRESRGLSQRKIARLGGPSTAAQSMVELGLLGSRVDTLCAMARMLDVPVNVFFLKKRGKALDQVLWRIYEMQPEDVRVLQTKLNRKKV